MIVQYYADSLGLSRPGIVTLQQRYIYLFQQWLRENYAKEIFLIDRSRRAYTIDKCYEIFKEDEEYITDPKQILIIHEGICDCAPRPIPQSVRRFISKLPSFLKIRIISFLHKHRASLLKKGFVHYLVSKNDYERILSEWLQHAVKNFERIYLFNIAPTNPEIESHSPGFSASIEAYNLAMKKVVQSIGDPKIILIDIHSFIKSHSSIDELITKEDGHHITARAHRLYASKLIELEKQRLQA
jgi:acyl-CoA thioesterase I